MGPRPSAAIRQLRVPGGAQENNHRGKLHPDDQADHRRKAAIHDAVRDAADVDSKHHVHTHNRSVASIAPGKTLRMLSSWGRATR